jgi:cell division septation protein DedD
MCRDLRRVLCGAVLLIASTSALAAQVSPAMSSAVGRARGLMDAGDAAAARAVLDSMVTRAEPSSDDLAEALFWRAVLSERVADGERDWKRLVVDMPLSPRIPDALLRLGELEVLRGRPAVARAHFDRILRDFSDSPQRPKVMIWIARTYFEERDITHACAAVNALEGVPDGELRLQADDLKRRCVAATANAEGASGAGAATGAPVAGATPPAATAAPPAASETPRRGTSSSVWSVQLAAYDTRAQATALVSRLAKRGVKARVDGERKPFRVRVGRYDTRAEAAAMLARLKKQGQSGFVAELGK